MRIREARIMPEKRMFQPEKFSYKHQVIPRRKRPGLIKELEASLPKPGFFERLPEADKAGRVRFFYFRGTWVAIKKTEAEPEHGSRPGRVMKSILAHHKALRAGQLKAEKYRIVTPKVYRQIGQFIVMEFMEGKSQLKVYEGLNQAEIQSINDAFYEMLRNFELLMGRGVINRSEIPQLFDSIVLGNTNPKDRTKGKWIFAPPMDFVQIQPGVQG
jgi:hypothetical protein